jgi:hypothetical protein
MRRAAKWVVSTLVAALWVVLCGAVSFHFSGTAGGDFESLLSNVGAFDDIVLAFVTVGVVATVVFDVLSAVLFRVGIDKTNDEFPAYGSINNGPRFKLSQQQKVGAWLVFLVGASFLAGKGALDIAGRSL